MWVTAGRYRPGDCETWKYIAPAHTGEIVVLEHWGSSGFANTDLDVQLKRHAFIGSSSSGS
jgi:ureidoacrylate peracid hydrolase